MPKRNVVHYWQGGAEQGQWKEATLVPEFLGGAPDLETLRADLVRQGYYAQLGVKGKPPKGNPLTLGHIFSV